MAIPKRPLTVKSAAFIFGISRQTIYRYANRGRIELYELDGVTFVDQEQVDWVAAQIKAKRREVRRKR